jgi:outer membrane receptor protein involved in Fe transport
LTSDVLRVNVGLNRVVTMDLVMKPAAGRETVVVSETATMLQVEDANVAANYSTKQVDLLPMPGGDITSLAFTVPGVVMAVANPNSSGYGNFSSNGLPAVANLFTMNGNDMMDPYLNLNNTGSSNVSIGSNEVDQVAIVQNAYGGQYGRQAGAQINYITKSGTNAFHGTAQYYWNGAKLNANDFFNNASGTPKSRANSNQYAASVGGPVLKNKLFFYFDTEGIRYVLPGGGAVAVPSQALQTYTLSQVTAAQKPLYQQAFNLYNAAPGRSRAVPVTFGSGPLQDSYNFAVDAYGGLGCGSLGGVPTGTGGVFGVNVSCADAFNTNVSAKNTEWLISTRVDYVINPSHKLFFRFKTDHGLQPSETSPISSVFNAVSNQPAYEGQVNHTWVISPRMVNNFMGSSNWYSAQFAPTDLSASIAAFPLQFVFFDGGSNGSSGGGGGMNQMGLSSDRFPQGRNVGQLQLTDDVSFNVGRHSFKAGVNYRYNRLTDTGNTRLVGIGRYRFFNLDEFARGVIDSGSSTFSQRYAPVTSIHLRLYNVGFYFQDDWAVRPDVKLTASVRFERTGNPFCVDNCFSRFTGPFATLSKGVSIPYNQSIQTGLSNAVAGVEALSVLPRVGLVYNPRWAKKTVIRGGIGLFADQPPGTIASNIFANVPNVFTPTVRIGTVGLSGAGTSSAISAATRAAFASGFANGLTKAQLVAALAPVAFTSPAFFDTPDSVLAPKYVKWSFELQQQLSEKNVFVVSYAGNHGYNLFLENAKVNGFSATGFGGMPTAAPDPRFNIITSLTNNGYSNYNGLSFTLRRGLGYGFMGQFSYTWSHGLDTISNGGVGQFFNFSDSLTTQVNPVDVHNLNYSSSDYDIRHNFTADFVWEIPLKAKARMGKALLEGWSVSNKWYARTSTPFSLYNSKIPGTAPTSASVGGGILANVLNPTTISRTCTDINTSCFTAGQLSTNSTQTGWGNMPRNSFRGPGYFDIDATLFKSFDVVPERLKFRVGASFYNVLNHPNFSNPGGDVGSSFGNITSAVGPPTSAYGSFQGSAVTGRVVVLTGKIDF